MKKSDDPQTDEKEKKEEIHIPELEVRIAKIVTTGLIEVPLRFTKYSVDREGKTFLFVNVEDEYKGIMQISQEPIIHSMNIQPKDLEALIDKDCEIIGYFRFNPSNRSFNLEKVEINRKISE